jgi:copper chaperone
MERIRLEIEGMSCGHCVGAVTKALRGLEGVEPEQVAIGSAQVRYDPVRATPQAIAEAVEDEGYPARVAA